MLKSLSYLIGEDQFRPAAGPRYELGDLIHVTMLALLSFKVVYCSIREPELDASCATKEDRALSYPMITYACGPLWLSPLFLALTPYCPTTANRGWNKDS